MTLGALLDLGISLGEIEGELRKLDLHGYELKAERTSRHGISAIKFSVEPSHERHHSHRKLPEIIQIIDSSGIPRRAKSMAKRIFDKLAEAEARVHGIPKDEVHFHEVGALDSIVDIVGSSIALDMLGADEVLSSPISLGRGFTRSAHGVIPIPAPATVELLKGVPVRQTEVESELTTPTGAAIISSLVSRFGPMPPMRIEAIGYGAGSRDLEERPNLLRVFLGELESAFQTDTVTLIETNIDDTNPEILGYVMERLMEEGALDTFFTPIYMKKNRPATKLTVIAPKGRETELARLIFEETTTIGVRMMESNRLKLPREKITVQTPYGEITVKVAKIGDRVKYAPEYESCKQIAGKIGVPIREIYDSALREVKKSEL